jgi:hypothetical protein
VGKTAELLDGQRLRSSRIGVAVRVGPHYWISAHRRRFGHDSGVLLYLVARRTGARSPEHNGANDAERGH